MNKNTLTFDTVRDIDHFCALRTEWEELWHRAKGEYFQSFAFCHSSLLAEFGESKRQLHCIVGRRDGKLAALWPLVTYRNAFWKYATPLGPQNRAPSNILLAPDQDVDATVKAVYQAALKETNADVFELWRIRSSSPLYSLLNAKNLARRVSQEPTHYALLRGEKDWDSFCRMRLGHSYSRRQYSKRRLNSMGNVSIDMVDAGDPRLTSLVDWLVEHKREWAQHQGIESKWVASEASHVFWKVLLTDQTHESGLFRLFVLTLDGVPLAVNVVAVCADCSYLMTTTYDLKHARLSAGTVLIDHCVKWSFEQGLDLDFGPGDNQYKSVWSGDRSYTTTSLLVLPTWWGQSGFAAKHAMNKLRDFAKSRGSERRDAQTQTM